MVPYRSYLALTNEQFADLACKLENLVCDLRTAADGAQRRELPLSLSESIERDMLTVLDLIEEPNETAREQQVKYREAISK